MSAYIDLHVHTTASDGTFTPAGAVALAEQIGLAAIAITDHDTASGVAEACAAGEKYGVEVVPGIEISVDYHGEGVHILGYFIDPASEALGRLLEWVALERRMRNEKIAEAMNSDGLDVSMKKMQMKYPNAVIGRPHFAAELVALGLVESVAEGFEKYLSPGGRYYRKREYIPIDMAFDIIHQSGGKAVFAHPYQYGFSPEELDKLTFELAGRGVVGIECIYSGYSPEQSAALMRLADKYALCPTGGSDFHGSRKPWISMGTGTGDMHVPMEMLSELKKA